MSRTHKFGPDPHQRITTPWRAFSGALTFGAGLFAETRCGGGGLDYYDKATMIISLGGNKTHPRSHLEDRGGDQGCEYEAAKKEFGGDPWHTRGVGFPWSA